MRSKKMTFNGAIMQLVELVQHPMMPKMFKSDLDKVIETLSEVNPEPHWIPVDERLPENGRQVLAYARSVHYALAKYDEMREADGSYKKQWVTFDAWKPFYTVKDVIAWMPLPEPYQPEEESE